MDIITIKNLISDKKIIWSKHVLTRMQQRHIKITDIIHCIENGEIIESYPNDTPYPSCLICGDPFNGQTIHIVSAVGDNNLWMVTVYCPDPKIWNTDLKTRRE